MEEMITVELVGTENPNEPWLNALIKGENLAIIKVLAEKYRGKIDLIYIDPPFASGNQFLYRKKVGRSKPSSKSRDLILEGKAYGDSWGDGIRTYLTMMKERLIQMHKLLSDKGSIYIHLDWHIVHYVKILMDEIFGIENFQSEIIWQRTPGHHLSSGLDEMVDHILYYSKSPKFTYNQQYQQLSQEESNKKFPYVEQSTGRRYTHEKLEQASNSYSSGQERIIQGKRVISDLGWRWTQETFDKRTAENPDLIYWTKEGKPRYKRYAGDYPGRKLGNLWIDIKHLSSNSKERLGFATQKPKALITRIIKQSSNPGDLVADFFCGSGTTLEAAEREGRNWIGTDMGSPSIITSLKRLLDVDTCTPFQLLQVSPKKEKPIPLDSSCRIDFQIHHHRDKKTFTVELLSYDNPTSAESNLPMKSGQLLWSDLIDYWAIDNNFNGNIFVNRWNSYRTHQKREILLTAGPFPYPRTDIFCIKFRVIDIFECTTEIEENVIVPS